MSGNGTTANGKILNNSANLFQTANKNANALAQPALILGAPGLATAVSKQILSDIDLYCATAYDDGHRKHLGASLIGDDCSRKLWYTFRWVHKEVFSGQQQRLFNRGHREEARYIEWLTGIGMRVWFENTSEPMNADGSYPQYRITGCGGHFGGSLDGIGYLPVHYNIAEPVLLEFKTNNAAGFPKLQKNKMPIAKPQHYAQTSTYGYKYGFKYVLYLNICKNNDELHVELAKLDHELGRQMEIKAERIITSDRPPARLSDNPTCRDCGWCGYKNICHYNQPAEKNCRSCVYAKPVDNKQWLCTGYNAIIPDDVIKAGCPNWSSIAVERHGLR